MSDKPNPELKFLRPLVSLKRDINKDIQRLNALSQIAIEQYQASSRRLNRSFSLPPITGLESKEKEPPKRQLNTNTPVFPILNPNQDTVGQLNKPVRPETARIIPSQKQQLPSSTILARPATAAARVSIPRLKPMEAPLDLPETLELPSAVDEALTARTAASRSLFTSSERETKQQVKPARTSSIFCWQTPSSSSLPSSAAPTSAPRLSAKNIEQPVPSLHMPSSALDKESNAYQPRLFSMRPNAVAPRSEASLIALFNNMSSSSSHSSSRSQ